MPSLASLAIDDASIAIHSTPGHGIELEPDALQRFAVRDPATTRRTPCEAEARFSDHSTEHRR